MIFLPKNCRSLLCCLIVMLAIGGSAQAQTAPQPNASAEIRVLLLTGLGKHDWRTQSQFFRRLLSDADRFDVRVCETPVGLTAESLGGFDVIVVDHLTPHFGLATESAVEAFVHSGKGLVVRHDALLSLAVQPVAPLAKLVPVSWTDRGSEPLCAPFSIFDVRITQPQHAAFQGIEEGVRTGDQPVIGATLKSDAELLATNASNQPLVFTTSFGKGRVFCTALGHGLAAMQERAFTATFVRGVEWAASEAVALPAPSGVVQSKPEAPRVLVLTGGHDHEASFYGLFDNVREFGWVPVSDCKTAFKSDLRAKYDVLVMYDFTRELDEKQK